MRIGVPKEIKIGEYRVGLVPSSARELIAAGHGVYVEKNAGVGVGISDKDYQKVGVTIVSSAQEVYEKAQLIIKVKEPQAHEFPFLREDHVLFAFLHLAPDPAQAKALMKSGCTAIAYETVTDISGKLPLLTPMSEVAGRFCIQAGAHCLEKNKGGSGILLGGIPGVGKGRVTIIGGGVVGSNALRMAIGYETNVTVLDTSVQRLRELDLQYGSAFKSILSTESTIEKFVAESDLLIGAVLIPGRSAPHLISREQIKKMKPGSVFVDVAIDQGGCSETSRPTTFDDPTYIDEDVVHYCVTNMPGAVPRTATFALNNATLPYIKRLADLGYEEALKGDAYFRQGLNVEQGKIVHKGIAADLKFS